MSPTFPLTRPPLLPLVCTLLLCAALPPAFAQGELLCGEEPTCVREDERPEGCPEGDAQRSTRVEHGRRSSSPPSLTLVGARGCGEGERLDGSYHGGWAHALLTWDAQALEITLLAPDADAACRWDAEGATLAASPAGDGVVVPLARGPPAPSLPWGSLLP